MNEKMSKITYHWSDEKVYVRNISENARKAKRAVVFLNGCFDVLHVGHIKLIEFAASRPFLKDPLVVVGLSDDCVVTALKGPGRPICDFSRRAYCLAALRDVDYVLGFIEPTPEQLIVTLKPDVLVTGSEYKSGPPIPGAEFVIKNGGVVMFFDMINGASTSAIVGAKKKEE